MQQKSGLSVSEETFILVSFLEAFLAFQPDFSFHLSLWLKGLVFGVAVAQLFLVTFLAAEREKVKEELRRARS